MIPNYFDDDEDGVPPLEVDDASDLVLQCRRASEDGEDFSVGLDTD